MSTKRLLFALDEDASRAEAQAETVTGLFDSEDVVAHLYHVFTDNRAGATVVQLESVNRAADVLDEAGFSVEYNEASGDPADMIVAKAAEIDADGICIAGRKRNPAGKLVFGSVTQDVILNTERPVLVCGTDGLSAESDAL